MNTSVRPILSYRDWKRFANLPYRLHGGEATWIRPLISSNKAFLSRRMNPYFLNAEAEYFLAERDGKLVGRILAHIDHNLQRFQGNRWGLFGFFEAENDPEIARLLLNAAEEWLAQRQCDRIVGPMEFSTNYNIGLRIEGHDQTSTFFEPWHPPYYRDLIEAYGMEQTVDTVYRELAVGGVEDWAREEIARLAAKVTEHGVTIRHMRKDDALNDLVRYLGILATSTEKNWGFVPLTDREAFQSASSISKVLDDKWALLAEHDGQTVGAVLSVPDYNQCLAHMNGRLFPLGWAKFKLYRRRIDRLKGIFFGVSPEYQHLGIAAAFVAEYMKVASQSRVRSVQMGWSLETNEPVNRAMAGLGAKVIRRYRVYEKKIAPRPPELPHYARMRSAAT